MWKGKKNDHFLLFKMFFCGFCNQWEEVETISGVTWYYWALEQVAVAQLQQYKIKTRNENETNFTRFERDSLTVLPGDTQRECCASLPPPRCKFLSLPRCGRMMSAADPHMCRPRFSTEDSGPETPVGGRENVRRDEMRLEGRREDKSY